MEAKGNYELRDEVSLARGSFYGASGVVFRVVFLFLANLILARKLGAGSYGVWALNFLILSFGNVISFLGLNRGLSRFIANYRAERKLAEIDKVIGSSLFLSILVSAGVCLSLYGLSSYAGRLFRIPSLSAILKITSFTFIPLAFIETVGAIFQGYEDIRLSRLINSFFPSLLWFFGVVLLVFTKISLLKIAFIYLFSFWIAGLISIFFLWSRKLFTKIEVSFFFLKEIFKFCLPLLFFDFLTLVTVYTDSLLIGYFLGPYKVGIYNIAFRIARLTPLLLLGNMDIFTPVIAKNLKEISYDNLKINELYLRNTKWIFILTSGVIFTIIFFPEFFLGLFGKDYVQGTLVLRLLLIGYLIYTLFGATEAMNIGLGDTKFVAFYTFIGALFSISFNFLLIPRLGIKGAGITAIISIFLMKGIAYYKLCRYNRVNLFRKEYIKFLFYSFLTAIGIGFFVLIFTEGGFFSVLLFIILFFMLQYLILKFLDMIDEKDIELFKRSFYKLKRVFVFN